jgi:DNA-directed RNA polymerase delta subunit
MFSRDVRYMSYIKIAKDIGNKKFVFFQDIVKVHQSFYKFLEENRSSLISNDSLLALRYSRSFSSKMR